MADAMRELRPTLRASSLEQSRRAQVFRDLAGGEAIDALETGGIEALRDWLWRRYPELSHG